MVNFLDGHRTSFELVVLFTCLHELGCLSTLIQAADDKTRLQFFKGSPDFTKKTQAEPTSVRRLDTNV